MISICVSVLILEEILKSCDIKGNQNKIVENSFHSRTITTTKKITQYSTELNSEYMKDRWDLYPRSRMKEQWMKNY